MIFFFVLYTVSSVLMAERGLLFVSLLGWLVLCTAQTGDDNQCKGDAFSKFKQHFSKFKQHFASSWFLVSKLISCCTLQTSTRACSTAAIQQTTAFIRLQGARPQKLAQFVWPSPRMSTPLRRRTERWMPGVCKGVWRPTLVRKMVTVSFFSLLLRLTNLCNHPKCTEPQLHLAHYLQGKDHMAPISHALSSVLCVCNCVCVCVCVCVCNFLPPWH